MDQCKGCIVRGNIHLCRQTECGHHGTWYAEWQEEKIKKLQHSLEDMYSGWKYIRAVYGDLPGVGWDRCDKSANHALED